MVLSFAFVSSSSAPRAVKGVTDEIGPRACPYLDVTKAEDVLKEHLDILIGVKMSFVTQMLCESFAAIVVVLVT